MKITRSFLATIAVSAAVQSVFADQQGIIPLPNEDFFPEGIALSVDGIAYVGSLARGEIWAIDTATGDASLFAGAEADLMSVLGVHVSASGTTLFACSSDPALQHAERAPELVAFNLADSRVTARYPFPEGGLCNDISELEDGTILVTDSAHPRIMALDSIGDFTEWLRDEQFQAEGFALNGIAVSGETVFVGAYATGALFAIQTDSDGAEAVPISLERPLAGPDGIESLGSGDLLVAEGQSNTLSLIRVSQDMSSGIIEPVATGFQTPTTVAANGDKAFVVQGQLGRFFGMDPSTVEPFELAVVPLGH